MSNPDRRKMHNETKEREEKRKKEREKTSAMSKPSLPSSTMPLPFGNFPPANSPSNFASNPLPASTGKLEYLCSILPKPPKKRAPALSPDETEEANAFVDAVLTDGDWKAKRRKPEPVAGSGYEWWLGPAETTDGETRKRRRKSSTPRRFIPAAAAQAAAVPAETVPVPAPAAPAAEAAPMAVEPPVPVPVSVPAAPAPVAPAAANLEALPVAPMRLAIEALLAVPVHLAPDDRLVERPAFLNDDWIAIKRTRRMGKSAGRKDTYYIHRFTGRKLRSLELVRGYLKMQNAEANEPENTETGGDLNVAAEAELTVPAEKSEGEGCSKEHENRVAKPQKPKRGRRSG